MFVVGYPCETQEMVLDAHNRAFVFFGGVPLRMVPATAPALPYLLSYDNPKTIVDTVFVGKERKFNRRFLTLLTIIRLSRVQAMPASLSVSCGVYLIPPRAKPLTLADNLSLREEPTADCHRYNCLLGALCPLTA